MRSRVRLHRFPLNVAVDRIANRVQLVEQMSDPALKEFEAPIGSVDKPRLAAFLGNIEAMVHFLPVIPNLLQLSLGDAEIGEKRRLARKLWGYRYMDWSRDAKA